MILIHITAWYRTSALASFLWNYSQFAVQVFVFCSGYVFAMKHLSSRTTFSIAAVLRRAFRLLAPYYLFLLVYLPVENLLTKKSLSPLYILQSITLTGGPDFNWAVLLFLQMAILGPVVVWLFSKYRTLFWIFCTVAVASSVIFLGMHITSYKHIMWLPWSLVMLFSWYIAVHKKWAVPSLTSLVLFLASGAYLTATSSSMRFFDNKYPPNIYYLSYGALWILVLIKTIPYIPGGSAARRFISYVGTNSYELFFIHFLILTVLRAAQIWFPWSVQFLIVSLGSLLTLSLLKKLTGSQH